MTPDKASAQSRLLALAVAVYPCPFHIKPASIGLSEACQGRGGDVHITKQLRGAMVRAAIIRAKIATELNITPVVTIIPKAKNAPIRVKSCGHNSCSGHCLSS